MRRLLAATLLALAAACGSDSSQQPLVVPGTWVLQTVNGAALPYVIQASGPKVELTADQLLLATGGTFTNHTAIRTTDGTAVTTDSFDDTGTWTVSGTALNLKYADGTVVTGALTTDGTLTLTGSGLSAIYRRQ